MGMTGMRIKGLGTGRRAFARALAAVLVLAGLAVQDCRAEAGKDAASGAGRTEPKALKVLSVGNSFSDCLAQHLPAAAKAAGKTLDLCILSIGGSSFETHLASLEHAPKPYGIARMYHRYGTEGAAKVGLCLNKDRKAESLVRVLQADDWDVITVQQHSLKGADPATFHPSADDLVAVFRKYAPKAEVVLQETWAYNPAHPDYGRVPHMGASPSDMYARLHANYGELARRHGLRVIPVGTAVEEFRRLRVRNPRMDTSMTPPDGKHLTNRGRYLQALVWLGALFPDVDLRALDYDGDMEPEVIDAARTAACRALEQAKAEWSRR